ncbi:hypothetical protein [Acidicapsa acidisoli]|uniref:hypothetical protein n=1 Tax=Acidicapsa acidisoli TaxID=1615681 RepID=UPI0021DFA6E9|nr:hypothetical protein [Acidicapsa acidisoli]
MTALTHPTPDRDARNRRTISAIIAAVVVAAVLIVSFLPGADKRALHSEGRLHSLGHFVAFSVVGYVAGRTSHSLWVRVLVFFGALIFGFGIEIGEHLIFHSGLEWKDVLVDAVGVVCGTLFAIASTQKHSE